MSDFYRDGDRIRRRNHKGALRRIVGRKDVKSVVPGGYVRGHLAVLTLECGHVTDRPASVVGKRVHCVVCIAAK